MTIFILMFDELKQILNDMANFLYPCLPFIAFILIGYYFGHIISYILKKSDNRTNESEVNHEKDV